MTFSQHELRRRALESLVGRRALLVGDFLLDTYLYGETVRVSREAPVLVVRKEQVRHRLGGAANVAANLAALGVHVRALGFVGRDASGDLLVHMMRAAGIDVGAVQRADCGTSVKTRVLAGAVGAPRQQVLRIDEEPLPGPDQATQRTLAAALREGSAQADVIVASDYGQGSVGDVVAEAVRLLGAQGFPVCVDSRHRLPAFQRAKAVTPNLPEAAELVGFDISTRGDVDEAGARILERMACDLVFLKRGRQGMDLFQRGAPSRHLDIVGTDEVIDVTGAGDTVLALVAAGIAAHLGAYNAAALANCAAGIVVTKAGTATASPAEILDAMERHGVELEPWAP